MTDYRSPAATHSTYAKDDPTLNTSSAARDDPTAPGYYSSNTTTNPATASTTTTTTTSSHPHHHHHHGHHHDAAATSAVGPNSSTASTGVTGAGDTLGTDRVVRTGQYTTGLESDNVYPTPVPVVGTSYQNRVTGAPNTVGAGSVGPAGYGSAYGAPARTQQPGSGDGLAVASDIGGPLGGSVVLAGQCECLRNGGTCEHGAGRCMCRGCTTAATTVNPGINIGVSTTQYTAPVGTTGLGGGVSEPGTQIAGVVNPVNTAGQPVYAAAQNCDCVKNGGVCRCPDGNCTCTNCKAHRQSLQDTRGTPVVSSSTTTAPVISSSTTTTSSSNMPGSYTSSRTVDATNSNNGVV